MDFLFAFYVAFTTRREKEKKDKTQVHTDWKHWLCIESADMHASVKKILVYKNSPVNSFYRKI